MRLIRFVMRNLLRGIATTAVVLALATAVGASPAKEAAAQARTGAVALPHPLLSQAGMLEGLDAIVLPDAVLGPNYLGIIDGHLVRTDKTGTRVASVTGTYDDELDACVERLVMEETGIGEDALRRAYDIIRSTPYQTMSHAFGPRWQDWAPAMALQLFELGEANCYRYASAITYVAIALGYDAQVRVGYASHLLAEHAWCEVTLPDGSVRVVDCSLGNDHAYPDLDWFMVAYEDAGVWYFDPELRPLWEG